VSARGHGSVSLKIELVNLGQSGHEARFVGPGKEILIDTSYSDTCSRLTTFIARTRVRGTKLKDLWRDPTLRVQTDSTTLQTRLYSSGFTMTMYVCLCSAQLSITNKNTFRVKYFLATLDYEFALI